MRYGVAVSVQLPIHVVWCCSECTITHTKRHVRAMSIKVLIQQSLPVQSRDVQTNTYKRVYGTAVSLQLLIKIRHVMY